MQRSLAGRALMAVRSWPESATVPDKFRASAPASSANLGPGFDCIALALDMRCHVTAEPAEVWTIDHSGDQPLDAEADDAVLRAARRAVGADSPLRLWVRNEIPIGRGLGSSSAAYAAGALAASRARGSELGQRHLFALVSELEGHPDNAAAAVYGGFVLVTSGVPHRLPWNPMWRPILAVPHEPLPTAQAREVLPPAYPADVVIRTTARMAALIAGLLGGDPEVLDAASGDEIHEAPRREVRPQVADLLRVARQAGAAHAAWSGTGPAVLALAEPDAVEAVVRALRARLGDQGKVITPEVATEGAI